MKDKKLVFDMWADFHLKDITKYTIEQIAAYVFVIDAMNFCFWPNNPSGQFEYEHMARNLEKMLDTNPDFFTPNCLAEVQEEYLREHIFDGNKQFALVDERARLLRELGTELKGLGTNEGSTFMDFIGKSGHDAPTLVKQVLDTFAGFRDQAIYQGR